MFPLKKHQRTYSCKFQGYCSSSSKDTVCAKHGTQIPTKPKVHNGQEVHVVKIKVVCREFNCFGHGGMEASSVHVERHGGLEASSVHV